MYCCLLWWRALKRAIILLLLLLVVACAPHFAVAVGAAGTAGAAGGSLVADLADVEADCPMMEVVHETLAAVISLRIADPEKVKWNAAAASS